MPKARQSCAIGSPSRSCATNRRRSSITEHSFHRTLLPRHPHLPLLGKSRRCNPCVRYELSPLSRAAHYTSPKILKRPQQADRLADQVFHQRDKVGLFAHAAPSTSRSSIASRSPPI